MAGAPEHHRGPQHTIGRGEGRPSSPATLFVLAIGFLAGVLVTTLVVPRSPQVVIDGAAAGEPGGAATAPGATVPGATGPGADGTAEDAAADASSMDVGVPGPGDEPASSTTSAPTAGGQAAAEAPREEDGDGGPEEPEGTAADASGAAPDNGGATARGVTGESIRIGVGVLDIGALRNLGPEFDNGDVQEHMQAWLEGVRRDGLLPVHGRDLEFVYRDYQPSQLDVSSQRQACTGFVDDDEVFAVIAGSQFQIGAECVAREKSTPVITSDGVIEETYQRSAPFLYTLQPSISRLVRNWVHWMHDRGLLDGATIGVYWHNNTEQNTLVRQELEPTLEALGQRIAAEHQTDQPLGGPQDAVAVQRFQRAGVDLALVLSSKAGFMRQADNADYYPTYAESDYNSGTSNTATSQYPAEQFEGTEALTAMRWGEWVAGMPQTAPAQKCVSYYEQHAGRRIDPEEREAEWVGMNKACDTGWVLLDALRRAGPDLTPETLTVAIQSVSDMRLGMHLDVSFGQGQYHGFTQRRTLSWAADCACWSPVGGTDGAMWVR